MNTLKVYSEVYEILNILGKDYISKLPKNIYEQIENFRDKEYIFELDLRKDIKEQKISEKALDIIAYFNLEYWCNKDEKKELIQQYKKNEKKYNKARVKEVIFNKITKHEDEPVSNNVVLPSLIVNEKSFIKRFVRKIKEFFVKAHGHEQV